MFLYGSYFFLNVSNLLAVKSGLLSSDQFNECVSTFTDATTEFLPDDFKIPNTGISRNFSL